MIDYDVEAIILFLSVLRYHDVMRNLQHNQCG